MDAAREAAITQLMQRWDSGNRRASYLAPVERCEYESLFAVAANGEGHFAVINADGTFGSLDRAAFKRIAAEAKRAGTIGQWHVYATLATYTGPGLVFHKTSDASCGPLTFRN